ncbi:MAG: hypothetical protein ACLQPH_09055 [Acidimicrobiales bacterium]
MVPLDHLPTVRGGRARGQLRAFFFGTARHLLEFVVLMNGSER